MTQPKKPATEAVTDGELSDEDLEQISGGTMAAGAAPVAGHKVATQITQDITVNKAKTADKAYTQMDAYIKQ